MDNRGVKKVGENAEKFNRRLRRRSVLRLTGLAPIFGSVGVGSVSASPSKVGKERFIEVGHRHKIENPELEEEFGRDFPPMQIDEPKFHDIDTENEEVVFIADGAIDIKNEIGPGTIVYKGGEYTNPCSTMAKQRVGWVGTEFGSDVRVIRGISLKEMYSPPTISIKPKSGGPEIEYGEKKASIVDNESGTIQLTSRELIAILPNGEEIVINARPEMRYRSYGEMNIKTAGV